MKRILPILAAIAIGAVAVPGAFAAADATKVAVEPNADGIFVLPKAPAARQAAIAQIPVTVLPTGGVAAPVK